MTGVRITHERLLQMLRYDPATGILINLASGKGRPPIGSRAGSQGVRGYRKIDLDGKRYPEHRLIWFYVTKIWCDEQERHIDHINGVRWDNRLANLRLATDTENQQNRAVNKTNTLGLKGVFARRGFACPSKPFGARIKIAYQSKHLGYFSTAEEAHAAYCAAAQQLFGEFARAA